MAQNKYFWFSFSGEGKNLGVLQVKAKDQETATSVAMTIKPEGTIDIAGYELQESELPQDGRLYTPEEMVKMGYNIIKTQV